MSGHEAHESIEHTHHSGNTRIALLIAVLAACLAVSEMGGKTYQQQTTAANIEASNLWAFFQAKSIRQTVLRTAAEELEVQSTLLPGDGSKADAVTNRIKSWRATADRYESEPSTNEGRKELVARAKAAEARRDKAHAAAETFEIASAAFQLAIVLASASVVAGVLGLAFLAGGVGIIGVVLTGIGWFAPFLLFHH